MRMVNDSERHMLEVGYLFEPVVSWGIFELVKSLTGVAGMNIGEVELEQQKKILCRRRYPRNVFKLVGCNWSCVGISVMPAEALEGKNLLTGVLTET